MKEFLKFWVSNFIEGAYHGIFIVVSSVIILSLILAPILIWIVVNPESRYPWLIFVITGLWWFIAGVSVYSICDYKKEKEYVKNNYM